MKPSKTVNAYAIFIDQGQEKHTKGIFLLDTLRALIAMLINTIKVFRAFDFEKSLENN